MTHRTPFTSCFAFHVKQSAPPFLRINVLQKATLYKGKRAQDLEQRSKAGAVRAGRHTNP